jgi:hypothetical protein
MRHHPPDSQDSEERRQRFLAYLADARTSDEEKGVITLVLLGHAGVYLLLTAAEMTWVGITAARVWRHRDDGVLRAMRTSVHKPTLAMFVAANMGYAVLQRATLARFDRRIALRS